MLSQSEYNARKEQLKDEDPLMKRINLSQIKIDKESIKNNVIVIDDSRVPVNSNFWKSLGSAVNVNTGLIGKMNKAGDVELQTKLLTGLKDYAQTREGDKQFLLVGNADNHEITNIIKADKFNRLSNETLFKTAETIMNEIPNMHVQSIDKINRGEIAINLIHSSQIGYEKLGPDEVFKFGISLINTNAHSRIDDFFQRLSCENGAMAKNLNTAFEFGTGDNTFRKLLEQMEGWAKNGFAPKTFQDRLELAMSTKASFAEMEQAMHAVSSSINEKDLDHKATLQRALEQTFFPEYDATAKRIFRKGYNPMTLTDAQKKFIKTDENVWDVVNNLTWIGSHNTQYDLKNPNRFKVVGGSLFTKTFDLQNAEMMHI